MNNGYIKITKDNENGQQQFSWTDNIVPDH